VEGGKDDIGIEANLKPVSGVEFFLNMFRLLSTEPPLVLLMLTTALGVGVYDCWIGVLPQLLTANTTHSGNTSLSGWGHRAASFTTTDDSVEEWNNLVGGGGDIDLWGPLPAPTAPAHAYAAGNGTHGGGGGAPWSPKLAGLCGYSALTLSFYSWLQHVQPTHCNPYPHPCTHCTYCT
jgi:hypothetical protein